MPATACPCPLCERVLAPLFCAQDYRRPECAEAFEVRWCAACGYGKVVTALTPDRVAAFYEIPYYTHGAIPAKEAEQTFMQRVRKHLAWRFDNGRSFRPREVGTPGRAIDLGCGAGGTMRNLADAGFSVVGVDPDPHARAVAAAFGEVRPGTAESVPAEAHEKFDYAFMLHVLEHTIQPDRALKNVHGLLKDGGKLIVEVPNCQAKGFRDFGPFWPWTDVPRHLHFFTLRSLTKFLAASGFRVQRVFFAGYTRQFDASWIDELNQIHDAIYSVGGRYSASRWARQSWGLLLRTALASKNKKFDSVRVHAVRA
jgi:SAM-dependent methyltransferase